MHLEIRFFYFFEGAALAVPLLLVEELLSPLA